MISITHNSKPVVFVADVHLSPSRPDITQAFHDFLDNLEAIDALYIMGDLFEVWLGRDLVGSLSPTLDKLQATSQRFPIYFCCGNRDFLLNEQEAQKLGFHWLPDHQVIDLFGQPTLVLHGDTLCTDDVRYQKYRRLIHIKWLQKLFLRTPHAFRHWVHKKIAHQSQADKKVKAEAIMDVNAQAVQALCEQHQVQGLIHGHTHRPNLHQTPFPRFVVGDWYQQSSVLTIDRQGHQLNQRPLK
jgi:UDP-2,3-diacylglucosamine hydrolase